MHTPSLRAVPVRVRLGAGMQRVAAVRLGAGMQRAAAVRLGAGMQRAAAVRLGAGMHPAAQVRLAAGMQPAATQHAITVPATATARLVPACVADPGRVRLGAGIQRG